MLENNNKANGLSLPLGDKVKINIGLDRALVYLIELRDSGEIEPISIDEVGDIIYTLEEIMDALQDSK